MTLFCLAGLSASALIGPKDGILTVAASTSRVNNPCSRITGRHFALPRSQSLQILGPYLFPFRVASIHSAGILIRTTRSDMTRHRGPSILSNTHPLTPPQESSTRPQPINRRLRGAPVHPVRGPFSGIPHSRRESQLIALPLTAKPEARAHPAESPHALGALPLEQLSFLALTKILNRKI